MVEITIPETVRPQLVQLASVPSDDLQRLLGILDEQKPRQSHRKFISAVAAAMGQVPGWNVEAAVQALMSMAAGRYALGVPVNDFAQGVSQSQDLALPEGARQRLAQALERALSNNALTVTAKAWELLTENATNFRQARILTDLRPIFSDADETPPAAIIVHTLRLTYWGVDGEHAFSLAMDDSDLEDLRRVVVRAQSKSNQLRAGQTTPINILPQERL
jgi:hypothetical protein